VKTGKSSTLFKALAIAITCIGFLSKAVSQSLPARFSIEVFKYALDGPGDAMEPVRILTTRFERFKQEAPSDHPELSAILRALKVVPEPSDYPSGDGLVQFWNNPPVLEILGGTLYTKATPTTMESLVYLGDLRGSLKSKAITISFEVKPKDYDSFRAAHCALASYALAMEAKARHASKNVINDLLAEARGLLPETAANAEETQQELLKAVEQEEALNAK